MKILKQTANKKVRNATKVKHDGIVFDSKLEMYMYVLLKDAKIKFTMKESVTLQEGFRFHGEWIRPIKIEPDFKILHEGRVFWLDTKGFFTDSSKLKFKLFKRYCYELYPESEVHIVKSQKACREFILQLSSREGQ